jgi:hypothetical protein
MVRYRRPSDGKPVRNLAGSQFPAANKAQDLETSGIGNGLDHCKNGRLLAHCVNTSLRKPPFTQ